MELRGNRIKARARAGERAVGVILPFPSPDAVELIARGGCDFVSFDAEHGPFSPETLEALCRTAEANGITPVARVPAADPHTVNLFLDRGVMGIIAPHIDTPEQAESLVRACRFAPEGQRSMGGNRGTGWDSAEDMERLAQRLNEEVLVAAMVESETAVRNLPAILEVDGIDVIACGPMDLAQSMGRPGQPSHPEVAEAIRSIGERARAAGRPMDTDVARSVFLGSFLTDAIRRFVADAHSGSSGAALGLI